MGATERHEMNARPSAPSWAHELLDKICQAGYHGRISLDFHYGDPSRKVQYVVTRMHQACE